MESIGEKLRSVRETKKLSIRDVAKDTNIAPRYVEALEAEEFDRFPGETYIIGFLRSYAEYLKLDADDMIQSYKGYKIGESITPLEELTRPTRSDAIVSIRNFYQTNRVAMYAVAGIIVILLAVFGYSIYSSSTVSLETDDSISRIKNADEKEHGVGDSANIHILKLLNGKEIVPVYKDEAIQFLVDTKEAMFVLRDIKENEVGIQILPQKQPETLVKDTPKQITFPGTKRPVSLTLKGLTEGRANIKVELAESTEDDAQAAQQTAQQPAAQQVAQGGDQTTVTVQNPQNLKISFDAEFTSKTYVEVYLDGAEKTRGIVLPGRKEHWEANQLIQLKIGNAGGVKARINNKDFTFGLPGQVANKVITWKKDPVAPNQYQIVVRDWY